MKLTKGLTWPFLLLALATTLVFMAGLAALQDTCHKSGFPSGMDGSNNLNAAFGMSNGTGSCNHLFRFYWFTFVFVMVTLLGFLITAITRLGLHYSRPFWVGMLTISILLMMIASEAFVGFEQAYKGAGSGNSWLARLRTVLAGAIMSVVSLILLLLAVGTDWERTSGRHRIRDEKLGGTSTTTTEHVAAPLGNVRVADQV